MKLFILALHPESLVIPMKEFKPLLTCKQTIADTLIAFK